MYPKNFWNWRNRCVYNWHYIFINIISVFFTTTMLTQLYVKVGLLLTCSKLLHGRIISLRRQIWAHKTSLASHFLLRCLYQAMEMSGHVYGCVVYRFCSYDCSTRLWNCSDSVIFFLHFVSIYSKFYTNA